MDHRQWASVGKGSSDNKAKQRGSQVQIFAEAKAARFPGSTIREIPRFNHTRNSQVQPYCSQAKFPGSTIHFESVFTRWPSVIWPVSPCRRSRRGPVLRLRRLRDGQVGHQELEPGHRSIATSTPQKGAEVQRAPSPDSAYDSAEKIFEVMYHAAM